MKGTKAMNPKISIIVPVYKAEPYNRKCVDSILAQTFTDFELILVDDGSPDNCGEICDEYARKDKRVIVIHKENGGQATARNTTLDIAKDDYIGFVAVTTG
jgi:glycosyltransferase involved in cell wall biosynthesis